MGCGAVHFPVFCTSSRPITSFLIECANYMSSFSQIHLRKNIYCSNSLIEYVLGIENEFF